MTLLSSLTSGQKVYLEDRDFRGSVFDLFLFKKTKQIRSL